MTAAEKLRMEIAQEAPFSKDEFISKISRLIKAYGYASFICDKHIRDAMSDFIQKLYNYI